MRFKGKNVLVTGAGHGIGLAIAQAFIDAGAHVAVNDIDSERITSALQVLGNNSCAFSGDVAVPEEARAVVLKTERALGGIDIAVSNAGIFPSQPFLEMAVDDWDRVMAVNVRGSFLICQAAAQAMVKNKRSGVIITISSGSARFARLGAAHYCASKAAVVMLTRVMALELAQYKIRVNTVSPGIVDIPGGQPLEASYKTAMTKMVPWGRMGRPEDVAQAVLLVCDPAADYITGQVIPVDGGLSSGRFGIPTS